MERAWKPREIADTFGIEMDEEEAAAAAIPPPQTPLEPMEYLSRSWSVSASEISKILFNGSKKSFAAKRLPEMTIPENSVVAASIVPSHLQHVINQQLSPSLVFPPVLLICKIIRVKKEAMEEHNLDKFEQHGLIILNLVYTNVSADRHKKEFNQQPPPANWEVVPTQGGKPGQAEQQREAASREGPCTRHGVGGPGRSCRCCGYRGHHELRYPDLQDGRGHGVGHRAIGFALRGDRAARGGTP